MAYKCGRGHVQHAENVYVRKDGNTECKLCKKVRLAERVAERGWPKRPPKSKPQPVLCPQCSSKAISYDGKARYICIHPSHGEDSFYFDGPNIQK